MKVFMIVLFVGMSLSMMAQPIDGITKKRILEERQILEYPPIREADIFYEKKVWRIIDTREKMNLGFANPEKPFFDIIKDAIQKGDLQVYSVEDDKFTYQEPNVGDILATNDTIRLVDLDTGDEILQPIKEEIDYTAVKRFKIKEVWFFDEATSTMRVRILGIAPLVEEHDEFGNFKYEKPLFWVYYPDIRATLARQALPSDYNDNQVMSWDDLFQMRYFSSYITKASNIRDNRLKDMYSGVDLLLESDKIHQEIFNFEQDLWSY